MRQTREAKNDATSLCTSEHGLYHDYRTIIWACSGSICMILSLLYL